MIRDQLGKSFVKAMMAAGGDFRGVIRPSLSSGWSPSARATFGPRTTDPVV
jgi:hypothetical protein